METEKLIGFFINTLTLRTDLSGSPTFVELLRRVREVTLGAYAHQEVPFERLVEELQPERRAGHTPLFQVAFGLQNAPREGLRLGGLELSGMGFGHEAVRFDLTVWAEERGGQLVVTWTYREELFGAERVGRMQGHFQTLLQAIVSQPETRLNALEMLTEEEKRQDMTKKKELKEANLKKFKNHMPKATIQTQESLNG